MDLFSTAKLDVIADMYLRLRKHKLKMRENKNEGEGGWIVIMS